MKAERTEQPDVIQTAITGKNAKVWLRENIEQVTKEEGETAWQYDEYALEVRDRPNLEQYLTDNFSILIAQAKQTEINAIMKEFESKIDRLIDDTAEAKGYGRKHGEITIPPSVACEGYAVYENQYQAEAIAFGQWKTSLWPVVYQIIADVETGQRDIPTWKELKSELPEMVWP
jgi:hypothetical protein